MASGDGLQSIGQSLKKLKLPSGTYLEYIDNSGCYSHFCANLAKLKLTDFPLGSGDWKSERFRAALPNLESFDNLKDTSLLSIYDFDQNWSGQVAKLRQESIEQSEKITSSFIHHFIEDLRLISDQITNIDPSMKKLKNLKKLSLINAAKISRINFDNLPKNLEVFNFLGNGIHGLENSVHFLKPFENLIHLSLALNSLQSEKTDNFLNNLYFPNLISLDLSVNLLTKLSSLIENLSTLSKLKSLNISANPFSLFSSFSYFPISILNLEYFNDEAISVESKADADLKKLTLEEKVELAEIGLTVESITGLKSEEFPGSISVIITSPFGQIFKTPFHPVGTSVQIVEAFEFFVTESDIGTFYSAVKGETQDSFKIQIFFQKGVEPVKKGGKKDAPKDKGKGKKGSKGGSAKNSRPESKTDEPIEEVEIFSGNLTLKELTVTSQHSMVHLGGAEFNPQTYVRPIIQKETPDKTEKGKGKGKKGKGEPKEDVSGPQPVVLNLLTFLKQY